MIDIKIVPQTGSLNKLARVLRSKQMTPELKNVLTQWTVRYRSFAQRRFDAASKGSGVWPPLKSTRKRNKPGQQNILRDTGTLFRALSPTIQNAPGSFEKQEFLKVTIGYGGTASHSGGGPTIAQIARWHQRGAGHLPKREIIVQPDQRTIQGMQSDLTRALTRIGNE